VSAHGIERALLRAVIATAVACALASCGKDNSPPQQQAEVKPYVVPKQFDRELNDSELDSLQRMRQTHRVTRDEYWDGYGGVLANDELEVWYPDGKVNALQGMAMLKLAAEARARVQKVFGTVPSERVVIICAPDIDLYVAQTGRQWWHYSRIVGDTISIQPPINLHTRGLLTIVGPREYYEWAIIKLSKGRAPRWVQEGFASHLAREAPVLEDLRQDFGTVEMSTRDMDSALERESDRQATRRAYYNAYRTVEEIVKAHGEDAMARFVLALGENDDQDAASRSAFGEDYDQVVEAGRGWARGAQ
jgi:hypothetical protein